ncbi:MAG: hypothetical protein IPM53_05050 [Anaerolineaceae bacterium]|nr:hypothetical protein [Anaerolineaceae bacterium]
MNMNGKRILYWLPRVLSIVFALFISLFALDVFGEGYSFWETVLALLMHLIPTFLVLIALIIAWRWERVGALLFVVLAGLYLSVSRAESWSWIIAGPLLLLAILFLFDWRVRTQARTG